MARFYRSAPCCFKPVLYIIWWVVDIFLIACGVAFEPINESFYRKLGLGISVIFVTVASHGAVGQKVQGQSEGFEVCNCEPRSLQYVKIDLTDTESCNDPAKDYEKPYKAAVMVLQTDTRKAVTVHNCQVRFSKRVEICGRQHHSYGHRYVAREEQLRITAKECADMVRTKKYEPDGQQLGGLPPKMELQLGLWARMDFYSHGALFHDGRCDWDSWTYKKRRFKKSYEETTVNVRIQEVTGLLNRATNKISLSNGLVLDYAAKMEFDAAEGTFVWSTKEDNCTESMSLVYKDNASIHRKKRALRKTADQFEDAMVVIDNKETGQTGGFLLKADRDTCVKGCHRTHINGLILCTDPHRITTKFNYLPGRRPSAKNLAAVMSHFAIHSEFRFNAKFEVLIKEQCELNRDGVLHQLADLAGNENPYALRNLEVQGIGPKCRRYLPGGAVGYIAACKPINVTRVSYPNCTREIPVTPLIASGNNTELLFADPITMVTQKYPTIVPCSTMMPVRWKILGKWVCSTPTVHECAAPTRLEVNRNSVSIRAEVEDINSYGNGIFSDEQMNENEAFLQSVSYRQPVINNLINGMTRSGAVSGRGGVHFTIPFDADQLDNLAVQVGTRILPMFAFIGQSYSIVVGALFFLGGLKIVVGILLRLIHIYRQKGAGWWMLTAVWATAFTVIGLPWKIAKNAYQTVMDDNELMELEDLDPEQQVLFLHGQVRKLVKAQEAGLRYNERMTNLIEGMASNSGPYQALAIEVQKQMKDLDEDADCKVKLSNI